MTSEAKQDFMLRISEANKSRLVVILYDMFLTYVNEAKISREGEEFTLTDIETYRQGIRNAKAVLRELIDSLNMEYDIARRTYQIYRFVERGLIMADIRRDPAELPEVIKIMTSLRNAYAEAAKQDDSEPLMKNADAIYAGMTYGKNTLSTDSAAAGTNRGFLA
ncbi:MAG: flagellar protein FliS [Lachnospiraceae bacterium]|nr:flagellar protein FliS [Lachnospiraceae bacterium]